MTVIATLITRWATVHASDSLTTIIRDGVAVPTNWERTKIVGVRPLRGIMSYWGLAEVRDQSDKVLWSTLSWMRDKAAQANRFESREAFAADLADSLNLELRRFPFKNPLDCGIGIHFTAYERVQDRWVPELFLVSNWTDPTYTAIRTNGVGHSRETFGTLTGQRRSPDDDAPEKRLEVADRIHGGHWLRYNNGDPELYNRAANAILDVIYEMGKRRMLRDTNNVNSLIALARRPIEVVSNIQESFCDVNRRRIGGRIHDLAVTPEGDYVSTSGDEP